MATMKKSDTYGPGDGEHWQAILADLATDLASVRTALNNAQTDIAALRTALNAHTHTENTAASYTQNATTGAANANTMGALTSSQLAALLTTYDGTK